MSLMLVRFDGQQYEEFVAQGVRPSVLLNTSSPRRWRPDSSDPVVCQDLAPLIYSVPKNAFSTSLDPDVAAKVRAECFQYFIRSHYRHGSRKGHTGKSWLDVNNHFEASIQYYWNLLKKNKITEAIFSLIPHQGNIIVLYYLCRILNIRTIVCVQSIFPDCFWICQRLEDFGADATENDIEPVAIPITDKPKSPFYMAKTHRISMLEFGGRSMVLWGKVAARALALTFIWRSEHFRKSWRKVRELNRLYKMHHLPKRYFSSYDNTRRFIYFPLHLQPEATTDIMGHVYCDQLLALEELARHLPDGMVIYAEENPKQTSYMREQSFYDRLASITGVELLDIDVPTFDLIEHSAAVATVTGTAGWEALQMGKPVITFGWAWYQKLPGIFDWTQGAQDALDKALKFQFEKESLAENWASRCRSLWNGILDPVFAAISAGDGIDSNRQRMVKSILRYREKVSDQSDRLAG